MTAFRTVVMQLINRFYSGGAELLACDIARRLPEDRFERHVCAILKTASEDGDFIQRRLWEDGVTVHCMEKQRGDKNPATLVTLRRLIESRHIDVLHTHCVSPDTYGALAVLGRKRPVIVRTLHSTGYTEEWIQAVTGRLLRSRFAASAAISEGVRDWALGYGLPTASLNVIHNGIDIEQFAAAAPFDRTSLVPGLSERDPMLISIGRMDVDEVKGFNHLIEALRLLAADKVKFHALLVGEGTMRPRYEERCQSLGIDRFVTFLGWRNDIPRLLKMCDLFVLASIREGLGLVVCEAGAAGVPVVVTAVPGVSEVVEHLRTGILVQPGSPPGLAAGLRLILDAPDRGRAMAAALRADVKRRFPIERCVEQYAELYERVVKESGR